MLQAITKNVCHDLLCENMCAACTCTSRNHQTIFICSLTPVIPEDCHMEVKMKLWLPAQRAPRLQLRLGTASKSHFHKCHNSIVWERRIVCGKSPCRLRQCDHATANSMTVSQRVCLCACVLDIRRGEVKKKKTFLCSTFKGQTNERMFTCQIAIQILF